MSLLQDVLRLLTGQLQNDVAVQSGPFKTRRTDPRVPQVDLATLSVIHQGKTCQLGDSLPFHLLKLMVAHPDRYFSYRDLCNVVWQRIVTDAAIRSTAKVLRIRLRKSRMFDLANAIDGSVKRHYGLVLARCKK